METMSHYNNEREKELSYKALFENERKRADLLQDELNSVGIIHYDYCATLQAEIALLKRKGLN